MKITKYSSFLEVYTDGSKLSDPEISAAAAAVVVRTHTTEMFNWKYLLKLRSWNVNCLLWKELSTVLKTISHHYKVLLSLLIPYLVSSYYETAAPKII